MEVLLGLLTVAPMSGYDLGQSIRTSVGFFWNESYGQIYPNLKTLAAGGLVTSKTERQKGKPDRRIYSITKKGTGAPDGLAEPLSRRSRRFARNELLLKLFFGAQLPAEILISYVEEMVERERLHCVQRFTEAEDAVSTQDQYPDTPYWRRWRRASGNGDLDAHLRSEREETLAELRQNRQETT